MDIAFDNIVVHQTINYIGALAFSGAYHNRMPKQASLIDEAIYTYPLIFSEILK